MDFGSLVSDYCDVVTLGGRTPKRFFLFSPFCLVLVMGWTGWRHTGRIAGVIVLGGVPLLLFLAALVC